MTRDERPVLSIFSLWIFSASLKIYARPSSLGNVPHWKWREHFSESFNWPSAYHQSKTLFAIARSRVPFPTRQPASKNDDTVN